MRYESQYDVYLEHSSGPWKDHAYTAKNWVNGAWQYIYGNASSAANKSGAYIRGRAERAGLVNPKTGKSYASEKASAALNSAKSAANKTGANLRGRAERAGLIDPKTGKPYATERAASAARSASGVVSSAAKNAASAASRAGVSTARNARMTLSKAASIAKNPQAYMNSYGSLGNTAKKNMKSLRDSGKKIVDDLISKARQGSIRTARNVRGAANKAASIAKNPQAYMNSYGSVGNNIRRTATGILTSLKNARAEKKETARRNTMASNKGRRESDISGNNTPINQPKEKRNSRKKPRKLNTYYG